MRDVASMASPRVYVGRDAKDAARVPGCSFSTWGNAADSSSAFLHMRMPLPPPPSEALSMTGYWTRSAAAKASSAL